MNAQIGNWQAFLDLLGLNEEPVGIFFSDRSPSGGIAPAPGDLPTRQKEMAGEIDWQAVFGRFSCVVGNIWRARRKKAAAYVSARQFGCPGAAFWLGFLKPQTETINQYVTTGIPGWMEGERYCDSPQELRRIQEEIDPPAAAGAYCVAQPLSLFGDDLKPLLVAFFARPETLCGLHQLATFVTNDPQAVVSPWGAACTNLVTWPLKFLHQGEHKAVLGGWDPSARKFFNTDELTFTVSYALFERMLAAYEESFLKTNTWKTVQKKIARSNTAWARKGQPT